MVEVEMSDDIRKFENKVVGGLTKRQLISVAIGVGLGAPLGIFVPGGITVKVLLVAFVALPALLCGWVKMDGMPLEILAIRAVYSNILCPRKRKLKSVNPWRKALTKYEKNLENHKLSKMSPQKRAAYLKRKKNRAVTYSMKKQYKVYR